MPDLVPTEAVFKITLEGKHCIDPASLLQECLLKGLDTSLWYGKANSFRLQAGKLPGVGYVLLTYKDITDLLSTAVHYYSLAFTHADSTLTLQGIVIVDAQATNASLTLTDETIMLVELADTRLFLARSKINTGYNVFQRPTSESDTDPELEEDTLNSSVPWTWEQMVDDIWSNLEVSIAGTLDKSKIDAWPTTTPYDFCFYGVSAWDALFEVLDALGMILVFDSAENEYRLYMEWDTDDHAVSVTLARDDNLVDVSHRTLPEFTRYPESVTVYFRSLGSRRLLHSEVVTTASINSDLTTQAGVTDILHSDQPALYDSSGTLTNEVDLEAAAASLAENYINGLSRTLGVKLCVGALNFHPNNIHDAILWRHTGEPGGGLFTEIIARPRRLSFTQCKPCKETANSECHVMRFQITSVDPSTRTALVEILARPVGCGVSSLPDTLLGGTVAYVCDPLGCFFNEPSTDLTGRGGWARYMQPNTASACNPYAEPSWEVFSLCCAIPECLDA